MNKLQENSMFANTYGELYDAAFEFMDEMMGDGKEPTWQDVMKRFKIPNYRAQKLHKQVKLRMTKLGYYTDGGPRESKLREKTASVSEVQEWYHEMKKENGEFPKAPDVALRFGISNSEAVRIINLIRDDWDNYDESKTVKLGLRIKRLEEALAITGLTEESSDFKRTKIALNKIVKAGFLTANQAKEFLSSSSIYERTHILTELKDIRNSDVYKRVASYIKRQIESVTI